ncbi:MAG TPA: lamin tail domain-containing protein [Lentzea sp.]
MRKRLLAVLVLAGLVAGSGAARAEPLVSRTLVINEVSTSGVNGELDEFVEVLNVSQAPQDLTGIALRVFTASCQVSRTIVLDGPVLLAGERLVVAGAALSSTVTAEHVLPANLDLNSRTGGVALASGSKRIDAVAWEAPWSVGCELEGEPALAPPPGFSYSITRDVLGTDTDDNRRDFHIDYRSP